MKLYRVHAHNGDGACRVVWCSNNEDAKKALKKEKQQHGFQEPSGVEVIEVPVGKKALLEWLNTHATQVNG